MRIGFVNPHYYPYNGGVETLIRAIAEHLAAWGHQVEVLTLSAAAKPPVQEVVNGVLVRRFKDVFANSAYPPGFALLSYLSTHRNDYDVINAHNYHALPLFWSSLPGKFCLVVSTHYHGKGHSRFANWIHPIYRPFGGWAVRRAQKVICASIFEQEAVQSHLRVDRERIEIVPDGVNLDAIRSAQDYAMSGPVLLYVGRLEKYKRIDLAIACLAYLPEEYQLRIIGRGSEEEALKLQVRNLMLEKRVEFLKNVSNEALYRWYRSAKILVMMSEAESFPMTSIEALAGGCRVVCGQVSPFTDLAQQFPEAVFPVRDPVSSYLAARIMEVNACPGRADVDLSRYDWKNIAAETLRIFESVLPRSRG